jgi:hypothetical protein
MGHEEAKLFGRNVDVEGHDFLHPWRCCTQALSPSVPDHDPVPASLLLPEFAMTNFARIAVALTAGLTLFLARRRVIHPERTPPSWVTRALTFA